MKEKPDKFLRAQTGIALLVLATVYVYGLGTPVLWGDEADTAAFARNVLLNGYPIAWDGQNVLTYDNCREMGAQLVSRKLPWAQYYVGALSLKLFGETTFGARALFALLGALCVLPLAHLLRREQFPYHAPAATIVLLIPQVVLFQRSARYYSLLTLAFLGLTAALLGRWKNERLRLLVVCLLLALIYHSHYLAGLVCALSVVLNAWLYERTRVWTYAGAVAAATGLWLIWYLGFPAVEPQRVPGIELLFENPGAWPRIFMRGIQANLLDLDYSGCLPLLGLVGVLAAAGLRGAGVVRAWLRRPLVAFWLLNLVLYLIVLGAVLPGETRHFYGVIRYMPHLAVALPATFVVLLGGVAQAYRRPQGWALAALCFLVCFNPLGVSFWFRDSPSRPARVTWWPAVYREIAGTPADGLGDVLTKLPPPTDAPAPLVRVLPDYLNPIFVFYGRDRIRIRPDVKPDTRCAHEVAEFADPEVLTWLEAPPDWFLSTKPLRVLPGSYTLEQITLPRGAPDASRPELSRHRFGGDVPPGTMFVYRRTKTTL